jgi:hypothetical protein
MSEPHSARFQLTADDLVSAARLFSLDGFRRPRVIASFAMLFVILATLVTLAFSPETEADVVGRLPFIITVAALPFLAMAGIFMVLIPIGARRVYEQQRSIQGEMLVGWSDAGLHVDSEYGSFDMPWSHFGKWLENGAVFLVFESPRLYRIIPKRVLTAAQADSLRRHLQTIRA